MSSAGYTVLSMEKLHDLSGALMSGREDTTAQPAVASNNTGSGGRRGLRFALSRPVEGGDVVPRTVREFLCPPLHVSGLDDDPTPLPRPIQEPRDE